MVRDVKPFVATRVPPWLDRRLVEKTAKEQGITEEEARKQLFKEDDK